MRLVGEQKGSMSMNERKELGQRGEASFHGVHSVDGYQSPPGRARAAEDVTEVVEGVMREASDLGARQRGRGVEGPMRVPIEDDQVAGPEESRDHRHVGAPPARVRHDSLGAYEGCQPFL